MRKVKLIIHETYQGKRKSEAVLAGNGAVRYGFAYDAIGNPLQWRDGMTFSWQNGRQLAAFAAGSVSASYTYGEGGIRTAKTITNADGSVTNITYHTAGGSPLGESRITTLNGETVSTVEIQYVYDASGTAYGISAFVTDAENNTTQYNYYYMHNLQGDVIGLWHQYAGPVCYYTYDAWGKLLSVTDANGNAITDQNHIAHINPIRYRGYYYDTESGLYYVSSRYYDPEIGRWISPEPNVYNGEFDGGAGLIGYNVYAYCANNPVMFKDETGEGIILACVIAFGIIGATVGGYAGYKIAQHYKIPKGKRWKYVLGGVVIGGASGALLGWGAGISVSAFAVKLAGKALFGKVVTSGGMLINLATQYFEKTKNAMNLNQVKQLITLCQKYGVDIIVRLVDLTKGHGAWSGIPHIHIGDKQIHIALTKEAVYYIRKLFGL